MPSTSPSAFDSVGVMNPDPPRVNSYGFSSTALEPGCIAPSLPAASVSMYTSNRCVEIWSPPHGFTMSPSIVATMFTDSGSW